HRKAIGICLKPAELKTVLGIEVPIIVNAFLFVLLLVLASALAFGIQLLVRQNSLIFRPSREVSRSPASLKIPFEDVRLHCAGGVEVHGWWVAGTAGKSVIFFHGRTGNMMHELSSLSMLHAMGVNMLMVEYPGYGLSDGRPSERGCYRAAEAAWAF